MDEHKDEYTNGGKMTGCVYTDDEQHWKFIAKCMEQTIVTNALHLDEFPYVA